MLHFNAALAPLGDVGSGWTRPMGMDLDPSGRLLVADTYANRVLRLDPADSQPGGVGGTVAPALVLSLGEGARFDPFTPGVARTYTTTVAAEPVPMRNIVTSRPSCVRWGSASIVHTSGWSLASRRRRSDRAPELR